MTACPAKRPDRQKVDGASDQAKREVVDEPPACGPDDTDSIHSKDWIGRVGVLQEVG